MYMWDYAVTTQSHHSLTLSSLENHEYLGSCNINTSFLSFGLPDSLNIKEDQETKDH